MKKTAVFLEVSSWFKDAFDAAQELDLNVVKVSRSGDDDSIRVAEMTEEQITSALISAGVDLNSVAFYWATRDYLIPLCGRLNQTANVRFFGGEVIYAAKNKIAMREKCADLDCHPKWQVLDIDRMDEVLNVGFPLVVKPPYGYSSIGVQKVKDRSELGGALENAIATIKTIDQQIGLYETKQILIEECVIGQEVAVDVMVVDGRSHVLAICEKSEMKAPFFEEISYTVPASTSPTNTRRLTEMAKSVVETLNVQNGPLHLEFIFNESRVVLLDIGLRIGGGGLSHSLVKLAYDIDFVKSVFLNLIGRDESIDLQPKKQNIALLYLHQVANGGVVRQPMFDEAAIGDLAEFVSTELFVKPGDRLLGYPLYSGLPGFTLFEIPGVDEQAKKRTHDLLSMCQKNLSVVYEEAL